MKLGPTSCIGEFCLNLKPGQEIVFIFPGEFKFKLSCHHFPVIEYRDEFYAIPLLLSIEEITVAIENIKDIKCFDYSFSVFKYIVAGYLSYVLKYKCPDKYASKSSLKYP